MTQSRTTYRGSRLFINDVQIDRATAFGSTSSLTNEDIFELGNAGLVDVVDDIPSVDITLDSNDYGSLTTLALIAGKPFNSQYVDFSQDMEYAKCDIYMHVAPPGGGGVQRSMYIENAFPTSVNFAYNVDGNFTESYGLMSDNKRWFLNDGRAIGVSVASVDPLNNEASTTVTSATKIHKVLSVMHEGTKLTEGVDYDVDITGNSITLDFSVGDITLALEDLVEIRYACDGNGTKWEANTTSLPALRKGQIEIFLLTDVERSSSGGGAITNATENKQLRLQSVSIDASLTREDLSELGSSRYYDRPLEFPLNIDVSLELVDSDLELFAKLVGENVSSANELSIDNFLKNVGVRVKLYKERDIDNATPRTLLKTIDIPYLIPTDESWNVSTDSSSATQSFSFRTHELYVSKPS